MENLVIDFCCCSIPGIVDSRLSVCLRVSGEFFEAPSVLEWSTSSILSEFPDSACYNLSIYPLSVHQLWALLLIRSILLGLDLIENIRTWWYTRFDLHVWAKSGMRTFADPIHATQTQVCCEVSFMTVQEVPTTESHAWEICFVPSNFHCSTSCHIFLEAVPFTQSWSSRRFYVGNSSFIFFLERSAEESAPYGRRNRCAHRGKSVWLTIEAAQTVVYDQVGNLERKVNYNNMLRKRK